MLTPRALRVWARPVAAACSRYSTMATPFKIEILPKDAGLLGMKLGSEEASKVSELLQRDLEV